MAITRWSPSREMMSIQQEMRSLWDRIFGIETEGPPTRMYGLWAPSIDVYETDSDVRIKVDLPGMTARDIDISIKDHVLSIKGERKQEEEVRDENFYRMERSYGSFRRMIELPVDVKKEQIDATFKEGVLTISLPKAKEAIPKETKIPVHE